MIAKQEGNEEEKYSHCLDAYNLAQMAVSKAEEVFHNVCSLIAVNEVWMDGYIYICLLLKKINLI